MLTRRTDGSRGRPKARIVLSMTDEDVVARASELLGKSYNSYPPRGHQTKSVHQINIQGNNARKLMKRLYPHMGSRRKGKIDEILRHFDEQA